MRYSTDEMDDPTFSQTVRNLRARLGVGREVIAESAEVAVNTVRNAELGINTTVPNLRRILRAMGYDLQIVRIRRVKVANRLKASEAA